MGTTEATEILLAEHPKGLDTPQIAELLRERGIFARSRDYTSSVYASMHNASARGPRALKNPKFARKADGLWYLARERARGA